MIEATVHPVAEYRFRLIQIAGHAGILRAAAGEHEHHVRRGADHAVTEHTVLIAAFQQVGGVVVAFGHHDAPVLKSAATLFEGKGDVCQWLVRMRPQMRDKRVSLRVKCCL